MWVLYPRSTIGQSKAQGVLQSWLQTNKDKLDRGSLRMPAAYMHGLGCDHTLGLNWVNGLTDHKYADAVVTIDLHVTH